MIIIVQTKQKILITPALHGPTWPRPWPLSRFSLQVCPVVGEGAGAAVLSRVGVHPRSLGVLTCLNNKIAAFHHVFNSFFFWNH